MNYATSEQHDIGGGGVVVCVHTCVHVRVEVLEQQLA